MGAQNIVKEIKQYQEKWLKYVQRMDINRLSKQALQYKPKWRRNIGQPRKRWRDQLHLEDQGTGNAPKPSWTWWWWWRWIFIFLGFHTFHQYWPFQSSTKKIFSPYTFTLQPALARSLPGPPFASPLRAFRASLNYLPVLTEARITAPDDTSSHTRTELSSTLLML